MPGGEKGGKPERLQRTKKEVEEIKALKFLSICLIITTCYVRAEELAEQSSPTDILVPREEKPLYSSEGKRDPFKPFIKIVEQREVKPQISDLLPPIKKYPLEEFRLVGIMWAGQQPKAMIVDPEKNTYVLGIGDEIGNSQGKIIEVRDNGILVEEKRQLEDVFGQKKTEVKKSVLAFREE